MQSQSRFKNRIDNISPLDGRYRKSCDSIRHLFSEGGLTKFRLRVEIRYLKALIEFLCNQEIDGFDRYELLDSQKALNVWTNLHYLDTNQFNEHLECVTGIFEIEEGINHDVKSIECYLRERLQKLTKEWSHANKLIEFIHFGLTSQDITTLGLWLQIKNSLNVMTDSIKVIEHNLRELFDKYKTYPLLSQTHGQPASPTTIGKEMMVFAERLHDQLNRIPQNVHVKFGGAVGNFNAHNIVFPTIGDKWFKFANDFVESFNYNTSCQLKFVRSKFTTQIDHYDDMASVFDSLRRMNVILIDLCRDIWQYISRNVFKLAIVKGEVGSSTMPHKVNPINFENAEGNLLLANTLLDFLSNKLPVSRLQRDLTDSTVTRNIGVAFGYSCVAFENIIKGLSKLEMNVVVQRKELHDNTVVIAEAIQQILRSCGVDDAYTLVKELTRRHPPPSLLDIHNFIDNLDIKPDIKSRLLKISPTTYIGIFPKEYNGVIIPEIDTSFRHSRFEEKKEGIKKMYDAVIKRRNKH